MEWARGAWGEAPVRVVLGTACAMVLVSRRAVLHGESLQPGAAQYAFRRNSHMARSSGDTAVNRQTKKLWAIVAFLSRV